MISSILLVASIGGFSLGLVACGIFLFSNRTNAHANRLLAITIFSIATIMLVSFLLEWNIDYYAYIYRFPSALYYLFLPTAYLYLRSVVNDEHSFKNYDSLHFLPALLHFVEMLPFYFTSYEYRRELARHLPEEPQKLIELSEGILPPYYHTVLRCIQGVVYIMLMVRILRMAKNTSLYGLPVGKTATFRWLLTLTCLIAVLAIPMIFFFVFPQTFFIQGTRFLMLVITLSFLVINLYLFFQPQVLYGISRLPSIVARKDHSIEQDGSFQPKSNGESTPPATVNLEYYKPILEEYIARKQPFLKQGYSISELSAETGIPQHHLSALLNRIYEMRFTDFLNGMRINYIRQNFKKADWQQLTLEGIAKMSGFNSRTTFFNAIKKATGLTPSEFMAEISNHNSFQPETSVE